MWLLESFTIYMWLALYFNWIELVYRTSEVFEYRTTKLWQIWEGEGIGSGLQCRYFFGFYPRIISFKWGNGKCLKFAFFIV